jgi:hypothetical protein
VGLEALADAALDAAALALGDDVAAERLDVGLAGVTR